MMEKKSFQMTQSGNYKSYSKVGRFTRIGNIGRFIRIGNVARVIQGGNICRLIRMTFVTRFGFSFFSKKRLLTEDFFHYPSHFMIMWQKTYGPIDKIRAFSRSLTCEVRGFR